MQWILPRSDVIPGTGWILNWFCLLGDVTWGSRLDWLRNRENSLLGIATGALIAFVRSPPGSHLSQHSDPNQILERVHVRIPSCHCKETQGLTSPLQYHRLTLHQVRKHGWPDDIAKSFYTWIRITNRQHELIIVQGLDVDGWVYVPLIRFLS